MHPTFLTNVLGRRAGPALAVTLAATAGVSGALAERAPAAEVPPRCEIVACPDLVISRVAYVRPVTEIWVTVKNIGLSRAGTSTLGLRSGDHAGGSWTVPPLLPGQEYRVRGYTQSEDEGVVEADWSGRIAESNELNNRVK
jgi:hypothetical protein